jgi:putative spermidine/putrescine transport system permease protein
VLENPIWTDSIAKSAWVASGTAVLSTLAGLALARVFVGLRSHTTRSVLQSLIYAPLVVPVILLAIGIYDVEARLQLLGTTHGLILAHAVIAFPLAFAVLSNALSNVDPAIEPAAWTLGASRRRAFWSTVMPNIVPGLIGALLITFVTSWDEAVIALFQTGLDKTLPVTIFSFLKPGVTPAVAAVATMLVGLVVLCVLASVVIGSRRARRRRTLPISRGTAPSTAVDASPTVR